MKQCSKCKQVKDESEFHKSKDSKDGRVSQCKVCKSAYYGPAYRAANREKIKQQQKAYNLNPARRERKSAYAKLYYITHRERLVEYRNSRRAQATAISRRWKTGCTPEQYAALLAKQNSRCAICGAVPNGKELCIDHDHETGILRELLCDRCNKTLGLLKDDPIVARSMAAYLEKWRQ